MQGDNVFLQNLVGNHPRRWERTSKVVECKEYDQYLVKVDGSGRTTRAAHPSPKNHVTPADVRAYLPCLTRYTLL